MAQQIQDSPKKKKKPPKKTAFLCCFGFSGDRDDVNLPSGKAKPPPPSASAGKRSRRCFSLSLCRKQKSASKTVPLVDAAAAAADDEPVNRSKEIHVVKSDSGNKKTSSKSRQVPAAEAARRCPGEAANYKTSKAASRYDRTDSIIIDKTKTFDRLNSAEHLTNHKKASKKNIWAGPTAEKTVLSRTSAAAKSQKKKKPAAAHGGVDPDHNIDSRRNQDFTYGMSTLMVILIIMLVWGRLCAIVCTAAWFYTVPRIRKNQEPETAPPGNNSRVSKDVVHFSSAESKKKVVLDGFLERNHRTTTIIL